MTNGPTLAKFWGAPQDAEENALHIPSRKTLQEIKLVPRENALPT